MSRAMLLLSIVLVLVALSVPLVWFVVIQPLAGSIALEIPDVRPDRLRTHTRVLSEELIPRDWRHPDNLFLTADYIRGEIVKAGGRVRYQNYVMEGSTYRNVIGVFGPSTDQRIVVGAHYDAFGELPGADDNASAVAGLLELAYLLGQEPVPLQVDLVAFTLEEPKTLDGEGMFRSEYGGSKVHARSLVDEGVHVRIMINLEMIGYFDSQKGSQSYPISILRIFYPYRGDFINIIGKIGQGQTVRRVKAAMAGASELPVYSLTPSVYA